MKDKHIGDLIQENRIKDLSDADTTFVEAHMKQCPRCRMEFEAARIASVLLESRAAQTLEPSPFFEARVMNAWRERQAALMPLADRLWQAWNDTKLLVSGLATSLAVLLVLTFAGPGIRNDALLQASADDPYSAESILFAHQEVAGDLTDVDLLTEIYGDDDTEN
ncbi:MAG TPA: zf-HC2 domain-containing protein [Pyrinomonadaceae bacterium]|nr:zf-HC2 domain-containing protein [Pyrinomonadaceae bacterium]